MCNPIEIMRNCEKRQECAQSVFNMGDPMCGDSNCIMFDHLGLVNAYGATVSKEDVGDNLKQNNHTEKTTCRHCEGKGFAEHYHDAGDHFGAGTSPFSGWEREPCKQCDGKGFLGW